MKCKLLNTEDRIKEAARKVFMQKGFKGATSREIAKEAGLNVALTNYYFRKKETLFKIIFMEITQTFLFDIVDILNKPIDLEKKIRFIMERELELQLSNPDMFVFFYNEIKNNSKGFLKDMNIIRSEFLQKWEKQINDSVEKKIIRKIDPISAATIVMGCLNFPIIASSLIKEISGFDDESYLKFLEQQKEYAIEMITDFLFLKKK